MPEDPWQFMHTWFTEFEPLIASRNLARPLSPIETGRLITTMSPRSASKMSICLDGFEKDMKKKEKEVFFWGFYEFCLDFYKFLRSEKFFHSIRIHISQVKIFHFLKFVWYKFWKQKFKFQAQFPHTHTHIPIQIVFHKKCKNSSKLKTSPSSQSQIHSNNPPSKNKKEKNK